ncbi:hypothetical protein [Breoghania sp.]|uniref:hypothetical protein n=1 Tax=Breoghania sp. TaxID=2065378 RepID=UPI0026351D9C|nr:hypothetical protein [Breoghania sp.]MDJ0929558.1 hypothetical protein [Breoghania sp.]
MRHIGEGDLTGRYGDAEAEIGFVSLRLQVVVRCRDDVAHATHDADDLPPVIDKADEAELEVLGIAVQNGLKGLAQPVAPLRLGCEPSTGSIPPFSLLRTNPFSEGVSATVRRSLASAE